jgi:hypothetical protein
LQHSLHRTAAAPVPGQDLTGSGGVITVTIDSDFFPTMARLVFDNGNGVFGDAKNKFVVITVTEINVRLERLSQMLMYGLYELNWANERVVQSFDALHSYKLHSNNNNNNNNNNNSVEYQNTRCCYQRS